MVCRGESLHREGYFSKLLVGLNRIGALILLRKDGQATVTLALGSRTNLETKNCKFSSEMLVYHSLSMQSVWQPEVGRFFYQRHRAKYLKRFVPFGPRLCQFIL
jgi:hypothetical protein